MLEDGPIDRSSKCWTFSYLQEKKLMSSISVVLIWRYNQVEMLGVSYNENEILKEKGGH